MFRIVRGVGRVRVARSVGGSVRVVGGVRVRRCVGGSVRVGGGVRVGRGVGRVRMRGSVLGMRPPPFDMAGDGKDKRNRHADRRDILKRLQEKRDLERPQGLLLVEEDRHDVGHKDFAGGDRSR